MYAAVRNIGSSSSMRMGGMHFPLRPCIYVLFMVLVACLQLYYSKIITKQFENMPVFGGSTSHHHGNHYGSKRTHLTPSTESLEVEDHYFIHNHSSKELLGTDTETGGSSTTSLSIQTAASESLRLFEGSSRPNSTLEVANSTENQPTQTRPHNDNKLNPFYHLATSPIPIYTNERAKLATRPTPWMCTADPVDASNNGTIVAFVHVYKAAGTTIRQFFHELAYSCHKTWVSLARCTGVLPSTIQSRKIWKPCAIEEVADGRRQTKEQYMYPKAKHFQRKYRFPPSNPSFEKFVDIYGGHARLGTGEYIFPNSSHSELSKSVRYIVFLRDPIYRFVSGMLYQNNVHGRDETLEQVVQKVKNRVATERSKDSYWDKSLSYLLTPEQRVLEYHIGDEDRKILISNGSLLANTTLSSLNAEAKAKLAIHNLYEYNAIIGMTERMSESLEILKHVLLNGPENDLKAKTLAIFQKFDPASSSHGEGVTANKSLKREVSTSAVVAELAKDEEHMNLLREYVRYEQMITTFAWTMHAKQYGCVVRTSND